MDNISANAKSRQSLKERHALSRLRQLLSDPGLMQASLFKYRRRCGKNYCRCVGARKYWHASWYVGFSRKGRAQMKCLPEEWVEPVRKWIARRREIDTLLDVISKLYWGRIKSGRM